MRGIYYVVVGIPLVIGSAFALAEIAAPAAFMRWRRRVTAKDVGVKATLRDWFDERLGQVGSTPWEDAGAVRRVRLVGAGLLIIIVLAGFVFLVLVPRSL